jgi:hypothetical protein
MVGRLALGPKAIVAVGTVLRCAFKHAAAVAAFAGDCGVSARQRKSGSKSTLGRAADAGA